MVINIQAKKKVILNMEKANILLEMVAITRVIGIKIRYRELVIYIFVMEKYNIQDNGEMMSLMDGEH